MSGVARKEISVKVDSIAWDSAKNIFEEYGISVSDAINIFLNKVRLVGGLPFEMRDDYTTSKEEIIEGIKEAVEEVKLYNKGELKLKSLDEILDELW